MSLVKYLDPRRYQRRLRQLYFSSRYDPVAAATGERAKFESLGLDIDAARARLDDVLLRISGRPFNHETDTDSVHWLLFAALSRTEWGGKVGSILEIGTFRGKTTRILLNLFPNAQIVTCDLPADDPILVSTYGREDPTVRSDNEARRAKNLDDPRVRFVEASSFFLPKLAPGPYDLVWVDGGHLYPEIAWDLCNAWHACAPGGIILCDDVIVDPRGGDYRYDSPQSSEVLRYIAARTNAKLSYLLKRLTPTWSADPRMRKFVALLKKPAAI